MHNKKAIPPPSCLVKNEKKYKNSGKNQVAQFRSFAQKILAEKCQCHQFINNDSMVVPWPEIEKGIRKTK